VYTTWGELYNVEKNPSMNFIFLRNSEKTALNTGSVVEDPVFHWSVIFEPPGDVA
jgi:hypothetical protein